MPGWWTQNPPREIGRIVGSYLTFSFFFKDNLLENATFLVAAILAVHPDRNGIIINDAPDYHEIFHIDSSSHLFLLFAFRTNNLFCHFDLIQAFFRFRTHLYSFLPDWDFDCLMAFVPPCRSAYAAVYPNGDVSVLAR